MAMPGVKPVMKSDFRLRLSRKTLSLYSSLSVNEGTMVSGARRVGSSSWGSRNAPGCPGCCRSGNWAAAGDAASTITPKTADARRRFTSQRVSHVFRLRKHLFDVEAVERLGAGVHDRGAMALTLERLREDLGHLRLIVDDQDLHFLSSPLQYLQVDLPILQTARESPRAYP